MEPSLFLIGADLAAVGITFALVQLIKFFLPSPLPASINEPVNQWAVVERLGWVPFVAAFVIAWVVSSLLLVLSDQPAAWKKMISVGLQTGAYAVVTWEAYDQIVSRIIDKIRGR